MKNPLDGKSHRTDTAEEKVNIHEDIEIKTTQTEGKKE